MAPPEKRAVAPGKQTVRVDNVKDRSWIEPRKAPLIGRVFFVTDKAELGSEEMAELDKIPDAYHAKLIRYQDLGKRLSFECNGYADHRSTNKHKDNYDLSAKRAAAVKDYLDARLAGYSSYVATASGRGIDYHGIGLQDSDQLKAFRRVDIIAESPDIPQPKREEEKKELLSTKWKARLLKAAAAGASVVAFDVFKMEIVDLTNNIAMRFKYIGVGLGVSVKGTPGFNADKSKWVFFNTTLKMNIMEFEGGAVHVAGQGQVSAGVSSDNVKLYGPEAHRGNAPVSLEWIGFSDLGSLGAGVGIMLTAGGIDYEPRHQKPYPPPGD